MAALKSFVQYLPNLLEQSKGLSVVVTSSRATSKQYTTTKINKLNDLGIEPEWVICINF
jgi:5,10-methylene-tetrahydrofolate dehydrogenase/methenyl tetrahydrofolate cyclohydrolase